MLGPADLFGIFVILALVCLAVFLPLYFLVWKDSGDGGGGGGATCDIDHLDLCDSQGLYDLIDEHCPNAP